MTIINANVVALGVLVIQTIFLAIVLGFVGYNVNRIINIWRESRRDRGMQSEALVVAARARAQSRHLARSSR